MVVAGTRPEFVKLAPVVDALERSDRFETLLVHSGQHYDELLSERLRESVSLPDPDVHLGVGSASHAEQTGRLITAIGELLEEHEPTYTVAQGDTNTVLAAAIAASKRPTTFCHVEAGLRSGDREMPEETNRVLADHVEGLSFAPTEEAAENLRNEGVTEDVYVTGNTVVDACRDNLAEARDSSDVLDRFGVRPEEYVVATIHRPRNVDDPARLRRIVSALEDAPVPVIFPAHPRTEEALRRAGHGSGGSLRVVDPLEYLDFLRLLDGATAVVTDSGGVQEEASLLSVPCLTVRPNTERPETVEAGVNVLVEPDAIGGELRSLVYDPDRRAAMTGARDLYGDGRAGERIVRLLAHRLDHEEPELDADAVEEVVESPAE